MNPGTHRTARANGNRARPRPYSKIPPHDLIDFYSRWPEFREVAVALAGRADLSASQRDTVNWLILLVDRIGPRDLGPLESE
jgi:hypothetical protein